MKIFNGTNRTTFTNNIIPIERNNYICIAAIDIDSVLKIKNKTAYHQAYLEQCKYKLKKRKIVNFIDDEIVDEDTRVAKRFAGLDLYSSIDVNIDINSIKK